MIINVYISIRRHLRSGLSSYYRHPPNLQCSVGLVIVVHPHHQNEGNNMTAIHSTTTTLQGHLPHILHTVLITVSVFLQAALGGHAVTGESNRCWTPGWTDSSFPQPDDTWTAFPHDPSGGSRDVVGQWWPTSAVEEGRDRASARQNVVSWTCAAFFHATIVQIHI